MIYRYHLPYKTSPLNNSFAQCCNTLSYFRPFKASFTKLHLEYVMYAYKLDLRIIYMNLEIEEYKRQGNWTRVPACLLSSVNVVYTTKVRFTDVIEAKVQVHFQHTCPSRTPVCAGALNGDVLSINRVRAI